MRHAKPLVLVLCALLVVFCGCGKEEPGGGQNTADVVAVELEEYTNSIGMKFKLIPAGEFMMGSPEDEFRRFEDLETQHRVRITEPYYLGVTEVTQGQWETVMDTRPWEGEDHARSNPDHAVSWVSWEDAVEFCRKLSEKEGREYRLPTEAEWEYACRAGSTTAYSFGATSENLSDHAWWGGVTTGGGNCQDERYAHAVGQKRANAWGLYDMHGNVYERCSDWYDSDYYEDSPTHDPPGPSTGSAHVIRGGSWSFNPHHCRSAYRNRTALRLSCLGFRVALDPAE